MNIPVSNPKSVESSVNSKSKMMESQEILDSKMQLNKTSFTRMDRGEDIGSWVSNEE